MSTLAPLSTASAPSTAAPADTRREGIAKAARGFEAIFVRQMLATARKADFGGDDALTGGQGMDTFRQMQDQHLADIAAERGSFGMAKMIEAQLARQIGVPAVGGASTSSARAGLGTSTMPAQPEPVEGPAQPQPRGT